MKVRVKDTHIKHTVADEHNSVSMADPDKWKEDLAHYHSLQGAWDRKKRSLKRKSKKKYLKLGLVIGLLVSLLVISGTYLLVVYGF